MSVEGVSLGVGEIVLVGGRQQDKARGNGRVSHGECRGGLRKKDQSYLLPSQVNCNVEKIDFKLSIVVCMMCACFWCRRVKRALPIFARPRFLFSVTFFTTPVISITDIVQTFYLVIWKIGIKI